MIVRMNPLDPNELENEQPNKLSTKVGFLGSVVATIGYIIATIGEGIALSEQEEAVKNAENKDQDKQKQQQLSDIEGKLDYLINEINTMKKKDDHFKRW